MVWLESFKKSSDPAEIHSARITQSCPETSVFGQQKCGLADLLDSGTCKADSAVGFWAAWRSFGQAVIDESESVLVDE